MPMNGRIVGLGVVLLVLSLVASLYTTSTLVSAGANLTRMETTQPYLTEGVIVALAGIILIAIGIAMPRRPRASA
jgi:ABC-type Na+ efflux pump permease subunit